MDIEPEQAWEVYRDLPEPTARECARILQQRGLKVSYDTVARWARRGEWRKRVEQLRAITGVGNPKDVAAALKLQADELHAGATAGPATPHDRSDGGAG